MRRLSIEEFEAEAHHYDEAVAATEGIASFCSSSLWQLSALKGLRPPEPTDETLIIEREGNWLLFNERNGNRVFFPFEAAWMFGCPIIGDPAKGFDLLLAVKETYFLDRVGFCLGGLPKDGPLLELVRAHQSRYLRYEEFETTDCMIIDLADGYDAWLARRSKKFRKTIRQLKVSDEIDFVESSEESVDILYDRILAIQKQTYKWTEGSDIFLDDEYRSFYGELLKRLQASKQLRILFAQRDGQDLAYIFGGVNRGIYRGLQMSYVESERQSGLGNALQIANLKAREKEGVVHYDLGMHSPYKERWADRQEAYVGAFLVM